MSRFVGALVALFLCACGSTHKVKGKTDHNVQGEVKTINEFVFRIDVSGCQTLEGEAQAECITKSVEALGNLVEAIKAVTCNDDVCRGLPEEEP